MNTYQIGNVSLNVSFNYFATYAILSNNVYFTVLSFLVIDIKFKNFKAVCTELPLKNRNLP